MPALLGDTQNRWVKEAGDYIAKACLLVDKIGLDDSPACFARGKAWSGTCEQLIPTHRVFGRIKEAMVQGPVMEEVERALDHLQVTARPTAGAAGNPSAPATADWPAHTTGHRAVPAQPDAVMGLEPSTDLAQAGAGTKGPGKDAAQDLGCDEAQAAGGISGPEKAMAQELGDDTAQAETGPSRPSSGCRCGPSRRPLLHANVGPHRRAAKEAAAPAADLRHDERTPQCPACQEAVRASGRTCATQPLVQAWVFGDDFRPIEEILQEFITMFTGPLPEHIVAVMTALFGLDDEDDDETNIALIQHAGEAAEDLQQESAAGST
ncbi:hypothetical protein SEVIR_6G131206v4 [Setaria viridis]